MKNSRKSTFLPLLTTLIISFVGCVEHEKTENGKPTRVDEPKDVIVSFEDAEEFYDTYTTRRADVIRRYEDSLLKGGKETQAEANENESSTGRFVPTRFVEFDYKELNNYLKFIEQEAHDANVDITSLRIYLTNYPNKEKFKDGKAIKEPRRNSVMMVPTTAAGKKNVAFYTADDSEDQQRKAYILTDDLRRTEKFLGGKKKEEGSLSPAMLLEPFSPPMAPRAAQSLVGNEGGLRPPS